MKALESVVDRYTAAVKSLDKQALLALYAPSLRMFDMTSPFELRGPETFAKRVDKWFVDMEGSVPGAKALQIESAASGDLAYMSMLMEYFDVDEEGNRRGMTNRLTWVLAPDGDDWKIIHEHTSVPLDEETMEPMFQP